MQEDASRRSFVRRGSEAHESLESLELRASLQKFLHTHARGPLVGDSRRYLDHRRAHKAWMRAGAAAPPTLRSSAAGGTVDPRAVDALREALAARGRGGWARASLGRSVFQWIYR